MDEVKTEDEINELLATHLPDGSDGSNRWPGMTYEQGVEAALLWALGGGPNPLADD